MPECGFRERLRSVWSLRESAAENGGTVPILFGAGIGRRLGDGILRIFVRHPGQGEIGA